MKKLIILFVIVGLMGCRDGASNGAVTVTPSMYEKDLVIKTASFNGHDYVYIKRVISDESGDWQHDPVCLLNDLDSLMNKHKQYNEYKDQ
jgi:hypothetical protein